MKATSTLKMAIKEELGILPQHLKINDDEIVARPELELIQKLDNKCIELGIGRQGIDERYGLNSILLVHYRVGKRSIRHASDDVIRLIAQIIGISPAEAFQKIGREPK